MWSMFSCLLDNFIFLIWAYFCLLVFMLIILDNTVDLDERLISTIISGAESEEADCIHC